MRSACEKRPRKVVDTTCDLGSKTPCQGWRCCCGFQITFQKLIQTSKTSHPPRHPIPQGFPSPDSPPPKASYPPRLPTSHCIPHILKARSHVAQDDSEVLIFLLPPPPSCAHSSSCSTVETCAVLFV